MSSALPDPATVRTLFLDAGGVLVRPNFDRVAAALLERGIEVSARALDAAEARARKEMDRAAERVPTDSERNFVYFNLVLGQAGVRRSPEADAALVALKRYHDRHNLWEWVPPGVEAALAEMAGGGRRLVVVSNSNGTVRRLLERVGLARHFALVVDSAEEGVEKPDPRIFRTALERAGAAPEDVVHVGDMYEADVVGARSARLRAVLLDEAGLYPEADYPRIRSLGELAEHLRRPPAQK